LVGQACGDIKPPFKKETMGGVVSDVTGDGWGGSEVEVSGYAGIICPPLIIWEVKGNGPELFVVEVSGCCGETDSLKIPNRLHTYLGKVLERLSSPPW
jgi:hypothetical protein